MGEGPEARGRPVLRWLWWALALTLALGAVRTTWYAVGPASERPRLLAQVTWLNATIEHADAAGRMQQLFPEGEAFTLALTALATGRAALDAEGDERARLTSLVADRNVQLRTDPVTSAYPSAGGLDHGVFLAGWQLHTQLVLARLTGRASDRQVCVESARRLLSAVEASPEPFLESYPGQVWPVDTVVAMAGVAEVDRAFGVPDATPALRRWVARAQQRSVNGLLPHHVTTDGSVLDGPRGSSGALALAFLPSIDHGWASEAWNTFAATYVTRIAGAVGVREFPAGSGRPGDVDSGPLVAGVSLSASAVGVAAASANGDSHLAGDLVRQAEIVGLPLDLRGERRYALGVLPVGDAFLAWARSFPPGADDLDTSARPQWALWIAPWLLALAALLAARRPLTVRR